MTWCGLLVALTGGTRPATTRATRPATTRPPRSASRPGELAQDLTKAERESLLSINQAQLDLQQAKNELRDAGLTLKDTQRLFDKRIVRIDELQKDEQAVKRAELAYERAKIQLERTRLGFLKDATLITVVNATKRRTPEGLYKVDVVLRNDSDLGKARIAMGDAAGSEQKLAALLNIDNIIVTLIGKSRYKDEEGMTMRSDEALIGDPYQKIIPVLPHGQTESLEFQLLKKDVDTVTVRTEYLGVQKDLPVFLKMEAAQDLPTVAAAPFAQQGRLGEKVYYNLELERLAASERSFSPVVLNLPISIPFAFLDPTSDARVTQIRFTAETPKQTLRFEVSVPEKLDKTLVDRRLSFEIFITHPSELKQINTLKTKHPDRRIPDEELQQIKGERVSLILIPQGIGKLDILIANSFMEISQEQGAKFKFTIYSSGTLALRRVTPEINLPLEWEGVLTPKTMEVVEADEKASFVYEARPPADVAIGEYTLKIACEGYSGIETVEAIDQNFTVRVVAKQNVTGMAVIVGVVVLLVLIIAVASVRISRR